jgi:hypothetical protein
MRNSERRFDHQPTAPNRGWARPHGSSESSAWVANPFANAQLTYWSVMGNEVA